MAPAATDSQDRKTAERMALLDRALDAVDALVRSLTRQGLQRFTDGTVAEVRATAQRAHLGSAIRLERQLEGLATLVERYRDRDPLFRAGQVASALNRIWLLARATRAVRDDGGVPDAALLGEARRTYVRVEEPVEVQALAAAGWVTDSGFVGITVHLRAGDRVLQASNAKPTMYFGEDPVRLLYQPLNDHVPLSVSELAHGAFVVHHAKLSADGRLSIHRDLRLEPAPHRGRAAYDGLAVDGWSALIDRLRDGLVDPVAGAERALVFVEPQRWGPVERDDTAARARQLLEDGAGASLWIDLPLAGHTALLVENLEALRSGKVPRADALVGHAAVVGGELRLTPYTAVFYDGVELGGRRRRRVHEVHLGLERLDRVRR